MKFACGISVSFVARYYLRGSVAKSPQPSFATCHVRVYTRARQEVFVFILHLFTGMLQMVVAQRVRGEGFLFLGSRW